VAGYLQDSIFQAIKDPQNERFSYW